MFAGAGSVQGDEFASVRHRPHQRRRLQRQEQRPPAPVEPGQHVVSLLGRRHRWRRPVVHLQPHGASEDPHADAGSGRVAAALRSGPPRLHRPGGLLTEAVHDGGREGRVPGADADSVPRRACLRGVLLHVRVSV